MRITVKAALGFLIAASVIAWVVGIVGGAVVPLFGGITAERLGEVGFAVGAIGELCAYIFGWLRGRAASDY